MLKELAKHAEVPQEIHESVRESCHRPRACGQDPPSVLLGFFSSNSKSPAKSLEWCGDRTPC